MVLAPEEAKFVLNWQESILNAVGDCDLTLVRCVRMIIRIVMPNTSPTLDLAKHAEQSEISLEDKEALVVWIRLLDEVSREGNRELCLRLQQVCEEVFHSQGYPNVMMQASSQAQMIAEALEPVAVCRSRTRLCKRPHTGYQSRGFCRQRILAALEAPRPSISFGTRQEPSWRSSYGTVSALCSRTCSGGG